MKRKISNYTLPRHFAIQFWPKPPINEMWKKSLFCFIYQIKDESKKSNRIDNLNNSVKNNLKISKYFLKTVRIFNLDFMYF